MKISIITTSFNSEKTIEDTIKSVLNQSYSNIEYIIVDGGSKDDTLDIVNKYKNKISRVISEKDDGIFDAMNKGVKLATGDIVGILNSDDFYVDNYVLESIVYNFQEKKCDACYGNLIYIDQDDKKKVTRYWRADDFQEKKLNYGWAPPHPCFFVKKSVYEKYGYFRLDFPIAADYELMLRFIKLGKIKLSYLDKNLVYMREGGNSGNGIIQRIKGLNELVHSWRVNNLKVPKLFFWKRPLFKIHQFFSKPF